MDAVDNFFPCFLAPLPATHPLSFVGERTEFRERLLRELASALPSAHVIVREGCYFDTLMAAPPELRKRKPFVRDADTRRRWRREFVDGARHARFMLAPMGFALNSFRFYEALAMGVPPILVSRDPALPLEHLIDYDEICFRLDADMPGLAWEIRRITESVEESSRQRMRRLGRFHYDTFLSAQNFLFLLHDAICRGIERMNDRTV